MNSKFKAILYWSAFIGACAAAIAYILAIWIMVIGLDQGLGTTERLLFSIIGAGAGITINYLLREQGIIIAESEEDSQEIIKEYNQLTNKVAKPRKLKTIAYWKVVWTITDIIVKGVLIFGTTLGMMYVFIQGSQDFALMLLAFANLLLMSVLGLLGMNKAYNKYKSEHLPVLSEKIRRLKLDELASVPAEEEINELHKEPEVLDITSESGDKREEHRVPSDEVQTSIHDTASNTRSDIITNSKLN